MIAVPVGHVRQVVVASPEFLSSAGAGGKLENPAQLAERPCVVHHGTAPSGRWSFRKVDTRRRGVESVSVSSLFSSNQAAAVIGACVAGLGFGRFLSYQVEPEVRAGRLEVLLEDFEPDPLPVQIVYPDGRLMSPRLRSFIDWMKGDLRKRPEIHTQDRLRETHESR